MEVNHLQSISHELPVKELVQHKHLPDNIKESQYLTHKESGSIPVMVSTGGDQVLDENIPLRLLLFVGTDTDIEIHHQGLNPSSFPTFPQPSWNVKEGRLEEQNKANPLVVPVVLEHPLVRRRIHSWSHDLGSNRLLHRRLYRISRVNPTVCVDDRGRNRICTNTVNGVPDILFGRRDHTEGQEDNHSQRVVETEDGVVDMDPRDLEQALETSKDVNHL